MKVNERKIPEPRKPSYYLVLGAWAMLLLISVSVLILIAVGIINSPGDVYQPTYQPSYDPSIVRTTPQQAP